jgi:hypothetical protein
VVAKAARQLCVAVILVAVLAGSTPTGTSAGLGSLQHPSALELVTGVRGVLSDDFVGQRFWLQVCEREFHGLAGVHTTGVRLVVNMETVAVSFEAAQITADVGRETRVAFLPAVADGEKWAVQAGIVYDSAAVEGLQTASLLSLVFRSRVRLGESVFIGGEVDRLRVWGEVLEGADATLLLGVRPVPPVSLACTIAFARWGGAQPGLAVIVNGEGRLGLSLGYENGTEAFKGAVCIHWRKIRCDAGVLRHPVLGPETAITLSWGR